MCGGGKSAQSTQSQSGTVSGAPQAIGMANTAWNQAYGASQLPFQSYGGEFVAPINQQQQTGISGINQGAGAYAPYGSAAVDSLQPYFGAATGTLGQGLSAGQGLTGAGAGLTAANASLNPNSIQQWMSPYIQNVVQATENQQQQQNQIQQSQLEGSAIQSGAFGGDRSGVAAANLAYQQNLANQPVIANLYNQGFSQALGQANTQQQAGLQAGAQFGALGNQYFNQGLSGSQQYQNLGQGLSGAYSGLGTTAQANQLQGAQAQLGAGTLQQQTQQAQDQALYNQFLQQQAYPFQTSQFLTNAAQGLAPIYGTQSNTTGTATQPTSFFRRGGAVDLEMDDNGEYRPRKAGGGGLSDDTLASLIAAHGQMYVPRMPGADQGPYGAGLSSGHGTPMPTVNLPNMGGQRYDSGVGRGLSTANSAVEFGKNLGGLYSAGKEAAVGKPATKNTPASGGWWGYGGTWGANNPSSPPSASSAAPAPSSSPTPSVSGIPAQTFAYTNADGALTDAAGNLITAGYASGGRIGFANGGLPYESDISDPYLPSDVTEPYSESHPLDALSNQFGGGGGGGSGSGKALSSGIGHGIFDAFFGAGSGKMLGMGSGQATDTLFRRGGRIGKDDGGGLSSGDSMGEILIAHGDMYPPPTDNADKGGLSDDSGGHRTKMPSPPTLKMGNVDKPWGAGDAVNGIAKMAPMIASFFAKGGRIHRDTGGGLSDPAAAAPDAPPPIDPKAAYKHNVGNIISPNGGFNGYATPEEGVAATIRNAQAYQKKFNEGKPLTLQQIAERWAPKDDGKNPMLKGNDPAAWANNVGTFMGVKPDQPVDVSDPRVASIFAQGVHRQEKGAKEGFDPAIYDQGTQLAFSGKPLATILGAGQLPQSGDPRMAGTMLAMNGPPPSGATAAPAPADKPDFWSRESGGLSGTERSIISLLSGLGGMASSPSRFFGGALLSGLGAGANTYGQLGLKGKQLDIEQQNANTGVGKLGVEQMAKNIELYNQLRVLAGGYTRTGQPVPQWITEQMNTIGRSLYGGQSPMPGGGTAPPSGSVTPVSGGGLSTPVAPPAAAPAAQPSAPLPPPVKVEPLPSPKAPEINIGDPTFRKALGPDRDPMSLRERARDTAAFGDTAGAEKLMERADKLEQEYRTTGKATGEDGKVIDVPGFAETQASVGRVGENQKWVDEQSTQAMTRAQAREQLDVIKGVLENYESGSLAGMKAQAQALAKSLGVNLPNTATMNAADYQEFMKSALRNVFSDVKDMGGRPLVSEISGFEKASANPELQPEANKMILAQMYARLNQLDKYYGDASTAMTGNKALDRGAYTADWLKKRENQLAPLVDEATQGLAVRGATPTDAKQMKENHTYIIEPGMFPGVTERGKYKLVRNPDSKKLELKKAD